MRRRAWVRRLLKWTGLAVCLLIGTVWAISYTPVIIAHLHSSGGTVFLDGCIRPTYSSAAPVGWNGRDGWRVLWAGMSPAIGDIFIPLWLPFLLVGVPTGWLWWRDRYRPPPGHCRSCGYNLTGNVRGQCSECGEQV